MECPKCRETMKFSDIESTAMREVYRCFKCNTRQSKRSALSWAILGGRIFLFVTMAVPPDPSDFVLW